MLGYLQEYEAKVRHLFLIKDQLSSEDFEAELLGIAQKYKKILNLSDPENEKLLALIKTNLHKH